MIRSGSIVLGGLVLATLPAGAEIFDTLERMRQAALAREDVGSAVIDLPDRSLKVVMKDGVELTLSPDNLDLMLSGLTTEAERKAEVDGFIAQVGSMATTTPLVTTETLARLRPVIGPEALFAETTEEALPLWGERVAPGLTQYLAIDAPGSIAYVTEDSITESGLRAQYLQSRALENLRGQLDPMQVEEIVATPWIAGIVLDGFYDCSLMLLPELWTKLAASQGPIGAVCPSRGQLIAFDASAPEAAVTLRGYLDETFASFPYPVSADLYVWTGNSWEKL